MTSEERIAKLEQTVAKLMAMVGIQEKPQRHKKQQQERIQIRKQILKIK